MNLKKNPKNNKLTCQIIILLYNFKINSCFLIISRFTIKYIPIIEIIIKSRNQNNFVRCEWGKWYILKPSNMKLNNLIDFMKVKITKENPNKDIKEITLADYGPPRQT